MYSTRSMQIPLHVLLLTFTALGATALEAQWNTCGAVEPPRGFSVVQTTAPHALPSGSNSSRVILDAHGSLSCSCRDREENSSDRNFEEVHFDVVDEEGRIAAHMHILVYPCLNATCSEDVVTVRSTFRLSNYTFELQPEECSSNVELHKSGDVVMFKTLNFNPPATRRCRDSTVVRLSQTHQLKKLKKPANNSIDSTSLTLTVRYLTPFDIESCLDAVRQNQQDYSKVVFRTSKKMSLHSDYSHGLRKRHAISKRDNSPPSFLRGYYSVQVMENVSPGTFVTVVEASDTDEGINGELTYSMEPSNNLISADYFEIHSSSGEITTTGTIDREMMPLHSFHVTATDGGGEFKTVFYSITVTDVNDNSPRFIMGDYYIVSLREDQSEQSDVQPFTIVDDDEGINSQISFTIENNTGNAFTVIPGSSGELSTLKLDQQLDYETLSFYRLTIIAQDGGDPSHSASATVDIEVLDVLDNPPMFNSTQYTIEVSENTDVGTALFTLNATTLDSPSIADIRYNIMSSSEDFKFTVDSNTGVLTLHDNIDYEQREQYELSVRAQTVCAQKMCPQAVDPQTGSIINLHTTVRIVVNIINVNDHAPVFSRAVYNQDIIEGTGSQEIAPVRANDHDRGHYGEITYRIDGNQSNITRNFYLNASTGGISTLTSLDYETQSLYSFYVIAEDGGTPPRRDRVEVYIHVIDINDEYPVFTSLAYNANITENSGAGVSVAQVEARDADSPSLDYYIASVALRSKFSIERSSGFIITRESLDREDTDFYTIEVYADDRQFQSNSNAFVYVTVEDENDRTPTFTQSSYSVEMSEFLEVNSTVYTVEALDEDVGTNSEVTYFSQNIPDMFHLDSESGAITLAASPDYEDVQYFTFLIWAKDNGEMPHSSSALVEITVTDENDHSPVFVPGSRSGSVLENSETFTSVLRLSATDEDSGSNAALDFSIIADSNAMQAFSIDPHGVIKTRHPLDREQTPSYNLVVEVRDRGTVSLSSTANVNVQIEDEIDYPPTFSLVSYKKEITTDVPESTLLVNVTASTMDDVSPSSMLYSLASRANRNLFRINQRSGVISAATLIRPTLHEGKYNFHVTAQHQHLSAIATVVIDIVQDNTVPRLKPLTAYVNIFSSLMNSITTFGAVSLERPHNEPVAFSLDSSNPDIQHYFNINSATGTISVTSAARPGHYTMRVFASSSTGVGSSIVHAYVHTVSNTTLENAVVVEFESGSEIGFVSLTVESFAATLTEIIPCTRDQVEIVGIQEAPSGRLQVAFAIIELDIQSSKYIPQKVVLDRLRANEGSSRLSGVVGYGSEICTGEPCPNFQQCSPVVQMYRYSPGRAYKVLQSTERVHLSHPFSASFACHCPPGFELQELCSVTTNYCDPSPCQFGAPCHNLHSDYFCECPPFTGGKNCSLVCPSSSCNPCMPDMCLHGSNCIESQDRTSYSCDSCPWPEQYSGPNCELTSVHITSAGYMAFPSLGSVVKTAISFKFSTISPDGSLLYTGRMSGSHDLLSIELVQGQLRAALSLGDSEYVVMVTRSLRKLNDGEWHIVRINLDGHLQRLTVVVTDCSTSPTHLAGTTDTCVLQGQVSTQKKSLDVNTLLYFGGVESHIPRVSSVSSYHFDGCLADLVIDDQIIDLGSPVRQDAVSVGCSPLGGDCPAGTCLHGECIPVWNGAVCHCEQFPECKETSNPVSLSNGYIQMLSQEGTETNVESFILAFRTRQNSATLVEFGDVASVQLRGGSVVYSQNTSSIHTSLVLQAAASDGLWHTVTLGTATGETEFSIDSSRLTSTHSDTEGFSVTSIVLGTTDPTSSDHFDGCLADFAINMRRINLAAAVAESPELPQFMIESVQAEPGCHSEAQCSHPTTDCPAQSVCENGWRNHSCVCEPGFVATDEGVCVDPCDPNPCQNEGVCVPEATPYCRCSQGYYGPTCALTESTPCHAGFYSPPSCQPCHCDLEGVMEGVCNSIGRCLCNSSLHVFSPPNDVSCKPCDCHMVGSAKRQCSLSTGQCTCLPHVIGRQCDRCQQGYAGMDEEGCKEAKVVSGLFTLKTVSYRTEFDREGSQERHDLMSVLADELQVTLARFSLVGEQDVAITAMTNKSGLVVVHYTVSSYSPYHQISLPNAHHTVASVMQTVVRLGWVGSHQVQPTSHFILIGCSSSPCDRESTCYLTHTSADNPQPFVCDLCPAEHTLDGIICRKDVNETCKGEDTDYDGISDSCDNCPYLFNPSQNHDDCLLLSGICPAGHSGGVLWSSLPEGFTDTNPCAPPNIGYAKRQCLTDGVWGQVDKTNCVSIRGQQFIFDAQSLQARQVMQIHQLLYSVSEAVSFSAASGITGGDLSAVARFWREVVRMQVESAEGTVSEDHRQLLKALATTTSNLLAPQYNNLWIHANSEHTQFLLSDFPDTLEKMNSLFRIYHSNGVSEAYMQVKTIFNLTSNFSGTVVYLNAVNNTLSSVALSSELAKNLTASHHLDIVIASYPTIAPLLSPSLSNYTVASAVLSVQAWGEGITTDHLSTPVVLSLAHTRKVYKYSEEDAKCVFWRDTESIVGWSSDGCEVININYTHTTCQCKHLTTFAALLPTTSLQPIDTESNEEDYHPAIFTYVFLGLTCFLLLLANLALWIVRWSTQNLYITAYKNLVLALLLTAVVFLFGIDRTEPPVLCTTFAIILDFLIISSLFWMLVVGMIIARLLLHPPPKRISYIATFMFIVGLWTIPILMCVIPVGVVAMSSSTFSEDFGYPHYCLVSPDMSSVLLSPVALLIVLIIIVLIVVLVLMRNQKPKKVSENQSHLTPGGIAATKNRARHHLGILLAVLFLYLLTWGAGLLTIYGYVFPDPARIILEMVFAITYTVLGGFIFIVLCLNKKVINAIRSKFESKYQNSSLNAMVGSSSLMSRLRLVGRRQSISPPRHTHRRYQQQQQQQQQQQRRIEATNNQLEATSLDLVSMEAHPRTPHAEPIYSQIQPASARRITSFTRQQQQHSQPPRRIYTTQTQSELARQHQQQQQQHQQSQPPRRIYATQPQPEVASSRVAPVPAIAGSSSGDADLDTDVTSELRPWYQVPESTHEQTLSPPTDIDYPANLESDNDDSSRADPSGVSTISINDLEDELQYDSNLEERMDDSRSCEGGRDSEVTITGSLNGIHGRLSHTPERLPTHETEQRNSRPEVDMEPEEDEERKLEKLRDKIHSPQPSADPMWYRRASGCEATGNMPASGNTDTQTNSPLPKTVTWADQEATASPPVLHNPRHSPDTSYCSSVTSKSPPNAASSRQSSHEGSPRPKLTQDIGFSNPIGPAASMVTPPLSPHRAPPEGTGAVVMFPSPHHVRKLSSGSTTPSPASPLNSSSSQHSSGLSPFRLPPRGVAVGQSPSKAARRLSSHDYHCNGPSAAHGNNGNAASQHNGHQHLVRHNPDGSKTLQSLV